MSVKERHRAYQLAGDAPGDDETERPAAAAAAAASPVPVRQDGMERRSPFERQDRAARAGGAGDVVGPEVAQDADDARVGAREGAQLGQDRHLPLGVRAVPHDLDRDVLLPVPSSPSSVVIVVVVVVAVAAYDVRRCRCRRR